MPSVAIIDIIGLTYDGDTLKHRGLGGSESAVILMSKELSKLGFDVTVFNNCIDSQASPGIYDNVVFTDISQITSETNFDVVISSRTVIPFLPTHLYDQFQDLQPERYKDIVSNAKMKCVWMHDTFCRGDELLEYLVTQKYIDEVFTLSDFHTSYVTNCEHGMKRMFEVLKNHIFMTRNGIVKYHDEVDITQKDPNLYVYNASATKGMMPLVKELWESIKERLPEAKLVVIGGYYRFRENSKPDAQEKDWRTLVDNPKYKELDVTFTGIITQKEIADILSEASFMIYPPAFPETFGISTLESLAYNTPLITSRFGALEETAVNQACYLMDYPIEPNSLFPHINKEWQNNAFVDLTVAASQDKYLLQQKQHYCSIVKDICGWDSVALQWKQHIYKFIGEFLPVDEYRKVSYINSRVHEVFGRRFSNKEEYYIPRQEEQKIVVITPVYNAEKYISKCIESVIQQDYNNWEMWVIDDCSVDDTPVVIADTINSLPLDIRNKVHCLTNYTNKGALCNQVNTITGRCKYDDIIMLLDGDDWLVNDNQIFHRYNNWYHEGYKFTYGSCWSLADNIPLVAQPYPLEVKQNKTFREHLFNWNMPYTHLRTFKKSLINDISVDKFKDEEGNWFKAGGDGSLFYELIERCDSNEIKCVQDVVYVYNDVNPLNDYKVNGDEQTKNATTIIKKEKSEVKKILIAIPTNKNIEAATFKSIYDLIIPEGYETDFQFFYGYQVDQVRNLIAEWAKKYDYLFAVDSDISFEPDTLVKLLSHDKDIVSGVYIQRFADRKVPEIYIVGINVNIDWLYDQPNDLLKIEGCGFGCVLIKSEIFRKMEYPHFLYKSAIDHKDTVSEDTYFCTKAIGMGYEIYCDRTIRCGHHGSTVFTV